MAPGWSGKATHAREALLVAVVSSLKTSDAKVYNPSEKVYGSSSQTYIGYDALLSQWLLLSGSPGSLTSTGGGGGRG